MNSALLSSKKMDWCTPQDFFDRLNEEFGFVLDAAATDKTAKCPLYYTPETDGLSQSWDRGGAVFCNPPYGREIGKWVKKAYEEAIGGGVRYCATYSGASGYLVVDSYAGQPEKSLRPRRPFRRRAARHQRVGWVRGVRPLCVLKSEILKSYLDGDMKKRAEAVDMMKHIAAAWNIQPEEVFEEGR